MSVVPSALSIVLALCAVAFGSTATAGAAITFATLALVVEHREQRTEKVFDLRDLDDDMSEF